LCHFAFLEGRQLTIFSSPKTLFQPLKTHFLTAISLLLAMFFMVQEGIIYTIAADIYAFRLAFSTISHSISHHFTLRLAPKRTAFSIKTHCILHQNALYLAAYCTMFCHK